MPPRAFIVKLNQLCDYLASQEEKVGEANLADAKAHMSKFVDRVEAEDSVELTGRDRSETNMKSIENPKDPIDASSLQSLTSQLSQQTISAAELIRLMRDDDRY